MARILLGVYKGQRRRVKGDDKKVLSRSPAICVCARGHKCRRRRTVTSPRKRLQPALGWLVQTVWGAFGCASLCGRIINQSILHDMYAVILFDVHVEIRFHLSAGYQLQNVLSNSRVQVEEDSRPTHTLPVNATRPSGRK